MENIDVLLEWEIPEIDEKVFEYGNRLVIALASQNETTLNLFLETPPKEDFIERFIEWKYHTPEKMVAERTLLFNHAIKKMIKDLNENMVSLLELLINADIGTSDVIEGDYPLLVKAVYAYIERSFLSNDDVFFQMETEESCQWVYDILNEKKCLVIFFELIYLLKHNHFFKIDSDRFNRMKPVMQMYLSMMVEYLEVNTLKGQVVEVRDLMGKLSLMEIQHDKIISKKKKQIKDYHDKVLTLEKQIKAIDEASYIGQIETLEASIIRKDEALESLNATVEAIEEQYVSKSHYDLLNGKFLKLHDKYTERGHEIQDLKNSFETVSVNLLEELASHLEKKGMTHDLYQLIYPYLDQVKGVERPSYFIKNKNAKEMIGYIQIIDGQHHVTDLDGNTYRLNNIPENVYFSDHQFVIVDEDVNCLEALNSKYDGSKQVFDLGVVRAFNGGLKIDLGSDNFMPVSDDVKIDLKENNVVNVKGEKVINRYDFIAFTYENYKTSIQLKNHTAHVLLKSIKGGFIGLDLINGIETFVPYTLKDEISCGTSVIGDTKGALKYIESDVFYQGSFGFDHYEIVTILKEEDKLYIEKKTGEKILFIPRKACDLKHGDVIKIDRFSNVISVFENSLVKEETDDAKVMKHMKENGVKDPSKAKIKLNGVKVLIVGDYNLSENYIRAFNEIGFETTVVSGHDPFHQIEKHSRKHDVILFLTKAASHSNYKTVKKAFKEKVLYINELGSNRVIEKFMEKYETGHS